jgi:transcriptional regulator with XRE-family HTH domain
MERNPNQPRPIDSAESSDDVSRWMPKASKRGERGDDEQRKAVAARIKQARLATGEDNASAFARDCEVTPTTVYRWEEAKATPSIFALAKIARATRTTMEWLVEGEESVPSELTAWLERARAEGRDLDPGTVAFLSSMPVLGYRVGPAFYDYALVALKNGLSPSEAARSAKAMERFRREPR